MNERTHCNRYNEDGELVPKEPFTTFESANRKAIERNFRNGLNKPRLNAYKCSVCGNYHVGRTNKSITRAYADRAKKEFFNIKVLGKIDLSKFKKKKDG